jgi:hypothetical protein
LKHFASPEFCFHYHALIVDDSDGDAHLMVRELKRGGFVVTHQRVETAAAFTAALPPENLGCPPVRLHPAGFHGREALQIATEGGLDLPFLFVSGTMGEEVVVEA